MEKEFNDYSIHSAVIVMRSPTPVIERPLKALAGTEKIRNSVTKNINTLSTWLKESERIMPRPQR